MLNYIKLIITIASFFSLAFIACEKEIPFSGETQKNKLVVHGLLVSNDSVYMHAGRSAGISDKPETKVNTEASIRILDGPNVVANFIHDKEGFYKPAAPFKPVPGVNYKLEASSPGLEPIHAFETVPAPVTATIDTFLVPSKNSSDSKSLRVSFTFTDPAASKDYYAAEVFRVDTIKDWPDTTTFHIQKQPMWATTKDLSVEKIYSDDLGGDGSINGNIFMLRDDLFNGKPHTLTITEEWNSFSESASYIIEFSSVSEAFFNHTLSKKKYYATEGDPFSQPVQIFNNIENGLGIFGGFSKVDKKIN